MAEPFIQPPGTVFFKDDNGLSGSITLSGEILLMPCDKKIQRFEMHRYFGAIPLNKDDCESLRVPQDFYEKYEQWVAGGRLVEGNLCVTKVEN